MDYLSVEERVATVTGFVPGERIRGGVIATETVEVHSLWREKTPATHKWVLSLPLWTIVTV